MPRFVSIYSERDNYSLKDTHRERLDIDKIKAVSYIYIFCSVYEKKLRRTSFKRQLEEGLS